MIRKPVSAALLACACFTAAPLHAADVPIRSLNEEWAQSRGGPVAIVHTSDSVGTGLLLPAGNAVLIARHTIFANDGKLLTDIRVGIPQDPIQNVVERQAVLVAEDPAHDLALLNLPGVTHLDAGVENRAIFAPAAKPAAAPCEPTAIPVVYRPERRRGRHHVRHREPQAHFAEAVYHPPLVHAGGTVITHIVYDGPVRRKKRR